MPERILTPSQNALLGIAAGSIEVCCQQPMLYLKNASQQGLPMTLDPRILYRGLFASVANMGILTGIQFPLTGLVSQAFTGGVDRRLSSREMVASGFCGGLISGLVCGPMELIMIQQQRFGTSIMSTPGRVMAQGGGGGALLRGVTTACGREGLFTAGYLGLAPALSRQLVDDGVLGEGAADVAGAIGAGVVAATLSHPVDTIKTCMQGDIAGSKYGTVRATASMLMQEAGFKSFFRGWTWRTGRMIGATFIIGKCKKIIGPVMFPSAHDDL